MALPPLASLEQLQAWPGYASATEESAGAVLSAASALVRGAARRTWLDDAGVLLEVPDDVSAIVVQAAVRYLSNPEGFVRETAGPFSGERSSRAGEGLYLTEAELAVLRRYTGSSSGLWTLAVTRDPYPETTGYVPVAGSLNPFPWY